MTRVARGSPWEDCLRRIVEELALPRLRYFPGDRLLDSFAALSSDLVHPADQGMELIARNWHRLMEPAAGPEATWPAA